MIDDPTRTPQWRTLDELSGQPPQPCDAEDFAAGTNAIARRQFLALAGASAALAGLAACTQRPENKIVPYVRMPEEVIPGRPLYYATAMPMLGHAVPLLVESHEGRPTKIEGNPEHPASMGACDVFALASIFHLYDPDRSESTLRLQLPSSWDAFAAELSGAVQARRPVEGDGVRILTATVTSPTLGYQLRQFLKKYPKARWHQFEPAARDAAREGARLAFGEPVTTVYKLDDADVIVSLDADFLFGMPGSLRYSRDFAVRRRVRDGATTMNRLYVAECTPSVTGTAADHRLPLTPHQLGLLALALAAKLKVPGVDGAAAGDLPKQDEMWAACVAADLEKNRGRCVVIPGDYQPAAVHVLVHLMNHALGNAGKTVLHTEPVEVDPVSQTASLRELATDMDAGKVELLVILGCNPVQDAPPDLKFSGRMKKVPMCVHLGLYEDETAEYCHWHVPETHYLEAWGDCRAYDGVVTIQQPLIAPLFVACRSAHEILALMTDGAAQSSHDCVKNYWKSEVPPAQFDAFWQKTLHDGFAADTMAARKQLSPKADAAAACKILPVSLGLEIVIRPDPCLFDGRYANNGWLQECPKPFTKITWGNAAFVSPAAAARLGLANGQVAELAVGAGRVQAPVFSLPGQPDDCVTVHLGYGRTGAGRIGNAVGFDANALRTSQEMWTRGGARLAPTNKRHVLARTQDHQSMEGRELVRAAPLEEYKAHPDFAHRSHGDTHDGRDSLYPPVKYTGYAWGMAIDTGACIGCNACMIACQSENNIPVVGKAQVVRRRRLSWIRVDQYYEEGPHGLKVCSQPVPCMQCETAPCEVVCPVGATAHSAEGLNDMAYNRCVGTRFCSNNCPYKVRRFNFLQYTDYKTQILKPMANPDVTVRTRGVMEKCTYCVQRINEARISAENEGRKIRDGEIRTACQAACPTQAIVFGDINNKDSAVAKAKASPLNYALLEEFNTRPRTTYLAAVRNPNPELEKA